jgi:hypothetical protein
MRTKNIQESSRASCHRVGAVSRDSPTEVSCGSNVKNPVKNPREELLKRLDAAWQEFKASYDGLSDAELTEQGVTGDWSIKDIVAHVTTWEEEALKHLPAVLEGRRPPRYSVAYGGIDAFNALMTTKKARLSLSEVLEQQEEVHGRVIDAIERAPESQLTRETRFRRRLRLDTYSHYPHHTKAIRRWRALPSVRNASA